jgi:hypothetical protein
MLLHASDAIMTVACVLRSVLGPAVCACLLLLSLLQAVSVCVMGEVTPAVHTVHLVSV